MKYYAAYGSNLNIAQMKRRCPNARVYGLGQILDYRLLFKGSKTGSYLTIEKSKGHSVPVAIWMVNTTDERALDLYEGYPDFYYKKEFEIECCVLATKKMEKIKCFVYIMHEERELGIPSRYYVDVCLSGYETFDFNPRFIKDAYSYSLKEVRK